MSRVCGSLSKVAALLDTPMQEQHRRARVSSVEGVEVLAQRLPSPVRWLRAIVIKLECGGIAGDQLEHLLECRTDSLRRQPQARHAPLDSSDRRCWRRVLVAGRVAANGIEERAQGRFRAL
jgi:hypothetical protein